jgi:hypothetical protein
VAFVVRLVGGIALLGLLAALRGPVNAVLRVLFDAALAPFRSLHPLVGLTVLAVPFAVLALLLFKYTSDQARIEAVKARIHAGLFEIRLFNDDLRAIFRAQGEILAQNAKYFLQNLVPLLWMIGPFVLAIAQVQDQFGYRGLTPGQPALLKVTMAGAGGAPARPDVQLEVPDGLELETPAVWASAKGEMLWRVAGTAPGSYRVAVKAGGQDYAKTVVVSDRLGRRSPARVSKGLFEEILHPSEPPLPAGAPIREISLDYPEAAGVHFDLSTWVWAWVGLTMVIAFALRGRFGVTI